MFGENEKMRNLAGKDFEKVVDTCPVPIVIAGGKKVPEDEALQMAYDALQAGAIGVNLGRNIWQSEYPVAMIRSIRAIIHENYTPKESQDLFDQIKQEKA